MVNPECFPLRRIDGKEIISILLFSITVDILTMEVEQENKLKGHRDSEINELSLFTDYRII